MLQCIMWASVHGTFESLLQTDTFMFPGGVAMDAFLSPTLLNHE